MLRLKYYLNYDDVKMYENFKKFIYFLLMVRILVKNMYMYILYLFMFWLIVELLVY